MWNLLNTNTWKTRNNLYFKIKIYNKINSRVDRDILWNIEIIMNRDGHRYYNFLR